MSSTQFLTLKEFLTAPSEILNIPSGAESNWLYLGDYKIYGRFMQFIEKRQLGDLRGGVIVEIPAGMYVIEAQVMCYQEGRHISRMRIHPKEGDFTMGRKVDEIHVGEGGLAINDVDALSRALDADQRGFRAWHKDFLNESFEVAGIAYWSAGNMEFPFIQGGFGEDYHPVYSLVNGDRTIGVETEYIRPGTPYPARSNW